MGKVSLFDITGKEIRSLINTTSMNQGQYIFTIYLNKISPGMYIMKVKLGNDIQSLKLPTH